LYVYIDWILVEEGAGREGGGGALGRLGGGRDF